MNCRFNGWFVLALVLPFVSCASTMKSIAMRSSPEFVGKHLPGILEKDQKKLDKDPDNQALILETGSYYVMYGNAFIQGPADRQRFIDQNAYTAGREKARNYYLKGEAILEHGLELRFPGIGKAISADATQIDPSKMALNAYLPQIKASDTELIYWDVAATLSAFALKPTDVDLSMKIRPLTALIKQVYKVNPDYNNGTLDDFFIIFNSAVPAFLGGDPSAVPDDFKNAVAKSQDKLAGPYVDYAESWCIPHGDTAGFRVNIKKALAIDPDADKPNRLMNLISQEKAQWLWDNADNLFINWNED
jgi:predicted anti-sigma-YlaC factor YlaD